MAIFTNLRTAAKKRALYNRTFTEIANLPVELAVEDLGIHPGDAHEIALRTVYGR